jgi:O-antigen ligase
MNRGARLIGDLETTPPLIAGGVIGAFALAMMAVLRLGLPIWSLLVVVAATAYVFLALHRPTVGLLVVVCVFFVPLRLGGGVSLLQTVGVLTAGLLLISFFYQQRTIVFGNILFPLLLLGVLVLVSLWFTRDAGRTTFYLRRWIFNVLFVLLLLNLVTTFETFKKVIWTVIAMAALNSIVGIFDFAASSDIRYRSTGLMENQNSFGHLAALAFPLALYQYLYRRGFARWLGLALCAVFVGGVVASVSRGAVLSLLAVGVAALFAERRRIIPLLLVVVLAFSAVPFFPGYFKERVGDLANDVKRSVLIQNQGSDLTSRGHLNTAGIRIWLAHPVIGVGIGNFGYYYLQREYTQGLTGTNKTVAHNIYVQALAETGLVGFLVLVSVIVISVRGLRRTRRTAREDPDRWIYFGAIEMMALAIAVSTASYGSLMNNDLWMFVGLTAVSSRIAYGLSRGESPEGPESAENPQIAGAPA